ncbi:hypothetical protein GCM10023260_12670 [Bartonella acomydis]|uniref:Uncharacterized protein n=1 Tax=Bartonella acomydis TaxID=686234 RepID=A0ABP9MWV3_9HYPH
MVFPKGNIVEVLDVRVLRGEALGALAVRVLGMGALDVRALGVAEALWAVCMPKVL